MRIRGVRDGSSYGYSNPFVGSYAHLGGFALKNADERLAGFGLDKLQSDGKFYLVCHDYSSDGSFAGVNKKEVSLGQWIKTSLSVDFSNLKYTFRANGETVCDNSNLGPKADLSEAWNYWGEAAGVNFSSGNSFSTETHFDDVVIKKGGASRDGLVAEYLFDGNAKDTSGQGRHGTAFGNVQYVQRGEGKAAYLKTGNDYIGIEKDFRLNEFTVSFFVNVETKASPNMFLNGANSGNDNVLNFEWFEGTGTVLGMILGRSNHYKYVTDMDFRNKWTHFAYAHDGKGLIELYLNGQHVKQLGQQISDSSVDIEYLVIGNEQDCLRGCYDAKQSLLGKIDDLRVYGRKLSAAEINSLYLADK